MEERSIQTIPLENGLRLDIYDRSRRVAGDRWLVYLVGAVDIDLDRHYPTDDALPSVDAVKGALGNRVRYSFEKKSHFVDESEKEAVFNTLKNDFLNVGLAYISRPGFAGKLILRRYMEKAASGSA